MKKVSMKKIAFVMTIAVAVAWNFPTALIAGASERVGAVDVLDGLCRQRRLSVALLMERIIKPLNRMGFQPV